MRHRRVWVLLFLGVGVLVVLHYSNKESPVHSDPRNAEHRRGNEKVGQESGAVPGWWKIKEQFGMFGKKSSSRGKPQTITEASEAADCSFSTEFAESTLKSFAIWEDLTMPGHEMKLGANLWGGLQADQSSMKAGSPPLKIFVMPHSHADPGWLKTFEEYTVDTNNALTFMLNFLPTHPNMTFTWTEVSFFQKWWRTINQKQQETVKMLIKKRQFELTTGSWTMTDEANPYFWASIDNIVEGHQFLQQEVGLIPQVEWSNDPFGYGPSVPYFFRKSGLPYLAINRVHKQVKMDLEKAKSAVFMWRQFWDKTGKSDMMTHILPYMHYDIPNSCGPHPDVCCQFDFKRLTNFWCPGPKPVPITPQNVAERAAKLLDQYRRTASMYRHGIILILLGDDFRFIDQREWYQQHDNYVQLFDYMNSHKEWNVEAKFGTFSDYFEALKERTKDKPEPFPSLVGDFFPYNDFADHYWTGYFTSRPFYKRVDRLVQGHVRAADIISGMAFAKAGSKLSGGTKKVLLGMLTKARRDLALFQHHDAITGTSKWKVVKDYGVRLYGAYLDAASVTAACAQILLSEDDSSSLLAVPTGSHLNDHVSLVVNELPPAYNTTEIKMPLHMKLDSDTKVFLFNPLPHYHIQIARFHVDTPKVSVHGPDGVIEAQINPVFSYFGGIGKDLFEVVFQVELGPLSLQSFSLRGESSQPPSTTLAQVTMTSLIGSGLVSSVFGKNPIPPEGISLKTDQITTTHDPKTGLLMEVEDKVNGKRKMNLHFEHYTNTRSGAYLFIPSGKPEAWPSPNTPQVSVVEGKIMSQVHSYFARLYHTTTVYNIPGPEGAAIHVENMVDIRDITNSEPIMILETGLKTEGTFYTDSVGFQFIKRHHHPNQPIETNYYPMPSAAVMEAEGLRLSVLSGQPHGVSQPRNGAFEIMLDRICTMDDYKGLGGQSLVRDNLPAKSQFIILLEKSSKESSPDQAATSQKQGPPTIYHSLLSHHSSQKLLFPPVSLTAVPPQSATKAQRPGSALHRHPAPIDHESAVKSFTASHTPLEGSFPCDANLLTVRQLPESDSERLLVVHRPGIDCNFQTPLPAGCTKNGKDAFMKFLESLGVSKLSETNLSGTKVTNEVVDQATILDMEPMDIRSFKMTLGTSS